MGLLRKSMSVTTVGLVRYRTKDERAHKVAKQTRNAARVAAAGSVATAKYTRQTARQGRSQWIPQQAPAAPAPGWYPDPQLVGYVRWWDGGMWTTDVQPALFR